MNIGMLWLDDSKRTLDDKLSRALAHYREKYQREPDTVWLNPMTPDVPETLSGLRVRTSRTVLPMHFWIGVQEGV